jgi:two-component system cell cycle sensor histidine kinase/response regulator CckA
MNTKLKILYLEDNNYDFEIISSVLEEELSCQIIHAKNSEEFIRALDKEKFDLIISDYTIPGYSGFEALDYLEQNYPETPFIFVSGTIGEEKAIECIKKGARDYIIKDRPKRLITSINNIIKEEVAKKDLKLSEEEIIRQNTLLTSVLDATKDGIIVVNLDGKYEIFNNKFLEIFDIPLSIAETKENNNILEYTADKFINSEDFMAGSGESYSETEKYFYDTLYLKNGKVIESNSQPYRLHGKISGRVWSFRDITEKKKLEEDFLRLQRVENLGAIASGIAHDLNNVLSPILMASEYFQTMLTDEDSQSFITIIQRSVNHATDLVKQILSFGRGNTETNYNINTNSLISNIIFMIQSTFPKTIKITQDYSEDLWDISGNQTQINQVLLNICINARDAMNNKGTLKIHTKNISIDHEEGIQSGKYVEISITDTGEGMSPEIMEKIFEPFFTTKEIGKGTGLGLATSKQIIEKHGGFIKLKSELGAGTEFKIYLPTIKSAAISNLAIDSNKIPSGKNELVLVVDDELSIREMMKVTLEVYNYRVLTAAEGVEAISIYSKNKDSISVIFVDLVMPLLDGVDTITVLRQINPNCKIIALTGLSDQKNIPEEPEGLPVLQKPFAGEQMLITLNDVLK